jgi:hypothetical protein
VIVVNFSHPLTPAQVLQIGALAGPSVEQVIEIASQFEESQPSVSQATGLANRCGYTETGWQTLALLIVPPAFSFIALALLAELYGRMGCFPTCIRLRRVPEVLPPQYEVAELLDLQNVRKQARRRRQGRLSM